MATSPQIIQPGLVAIGSVQAPGQWGAWTTSATALGAATTKLHAMAAWEEVLASGGLYWFPSAGRVAGALALLAGHTSDPNNLTFTGRGWITYHDPISGNNYEVTAVPAFDLACTVGNTALTSGSALARNATDTHKWVDTITATNDGTLSPGVRHLGGGVADIADRIVWDFAGGSGLLLQLTIGSVTALRPRFNAF